MGSQNERIQYPVLEQGSLGVLTLGELPVIWEFLVATATWHG